MPAAGPEAMAVGPTNWPLAVPYDPQVVTKRYGGAATAVPLNINASTARVEAKNSADERVKATADATPGQHERHRRGPPIVEAESQRAGQRRPLGTDPPARAGRGIATRQGSSG